MYIIKNALKCIGRSKGRNVLISIIALVIAVSACLGLSIRQAAENAQKTTLSELTITAKIKYDASKAYENAQQQGQIPTPGSGGSNRNPFAQMKGNAASLSFEEYQKYAEAESVADFYYTLSAYFNGTDTFLPVSDETEEEEESEETKNENSNSNRPGGGKDFPADMPNFSGGMGFSITDFSVVGYSSDLAMTDFLDGTASILEGGTMFEEGSTEMECVVSEELALYNDLAVGDKIVLTNPKVDTEQYELTVVGIYESSAESSLSMPVFSKNQDPANKIYMSAAALQVILDTSAEFAVITTNETTGETTESTIEGTVSEEDATFVFASKEDYDAFENEVREMGLDESYSVSSSDLLSYEESITPLNTLSEMAGGFLWVILIIGAVILVVLNIFNVRERKYEVGVLTAMGMKKWKVATQFVCEILVVTMISVVIGAAIGAVSSVPVTNTLLEGQVKSQSEQQSEREENFQRDPNTGRGPGGMQGGMPNFSGGRPSFDEGKGGFEKAANEAQEYISQVNSAMNLTVVAQMILVGLLLTLVASMASVLFIMRYDPLKILANRD